MNLVSELATASKVKFRLDTHKEHATLYLYPRRTARSQISDQFLHETAERHFDHGGRILRLQDLFAKAARLRK